MNQWEKKVEDKKAVVGVLGLGYVGLPLTREFATAGLKMTSKKLSAKMLAGYDVVLISTDHSDYDYSWIVKNVRLVVDTRNATAGVRASKKITKA